MPQMAPISWLILFAVFSISFMLFNILNYYCFNYTKKSISLENNNNNNNINKPLYNNNNNLNWKW